MAAASAHRSGHKRKVAVTNADCVDDVTEICVVSSKKAKTLTACKQFLHWQLGGKSNEVSTGSGSLFLTAQEIKGSATSVSDCELSNAVLPTVTDSNVLVKEVSADSALLSKELENLIISGPEKCRILFANKFEVKQYCEFLVADEVISKYLKADYCHLTTDKFLLAMVFIYFKRANSPEYDRDKFFGLLYLANDTEEDEEEYKWELLAWACGSEDWRSYYGEFMKKRSKLWSDMKFRTLINQPTLLKVMQLYPHEIWKRERKEYHAGAVRPWMRPFILHNPDHDDDTIYPRGPNKTPLVCRKCTHRVAYSALPTRVRQRVVNLEPSESMSSGLRQKIAEKRRLALGNKQVDREK